MPFVRKLANKLTELQKKNDEVANFFDSIPEWAEFVDSHLKKHNEIESKALGTKKQDEEKNHSPQDDFFDIMFKLKSASASGNSNEDKNDNKDDDDDSDEEEDIFGATKKVESMFPQAGDDDEEKKDDSSSDDED